jgi:hypothetical protein
MLANVCIRDTLDRIKLSNETRYAGEHSHITLARQAFWLNVRQGAAGSLVKRWTWLFGSVRPVNSI